MDLRESPVATGLWSHAPCIPIAFVVFLYNLGRRCQGCMETEWGSALRAWSMCASDHMAFSMHAVIACRLATSWPHSLCLKEAIKCFNIKIGNKRGACILVAALAASVVCCVCVVVRTSVLCLLLRAIYARLNFKIAMNLHVVCAHRCTLAEAFSQTYSVKATQL